MGFTASFAFVRSTGSSEVSMIPLDQPTAGGTGSLDKFNAGQKAPAEAGTPAHAAAIVASPDMHDAVFVMNPAERMIYYYHYMEGMPIPSGGLTTYGFKPQAVLIARKGLRETDPGTYSSTVRLDDPGEYDLVFVLNEPRVVECVPIVSVRADPERTKGRLALDADFLGEARALRTGGNLLRFRLTDAHSGRPLEGLESVRVVISTPGRGQVRAAGRPEKNGEYVFSVSVPESAIYYVSFEVPSLGVSARSRPLLTLPAAGAEGSD